MEIALVKTKHRLLELKKTHVYDGNRYIHPMHGFNNGHPVLKDLCAENDFIFVQEHWLMSSHLSKFNNMHDNFLFYGVSAMDSACSKGILRGRPFGGVGVLVRKYLANYFFLWLSSAE